MTDTTTDIAERLRTKLADLERQTSSHLAFPVSEIALLLERIDALQRDNEQLRRQAAKGGEMIQAAASFLEAYGRKYRNFAGGGIRPTAILLNEVKVMWAVHNDFRTLTESEF